MCSMLIISKIAAGLSLQGVRIVYVSEYKRNKQHELKSAHLHLRYPNI